MKTDTMDFMRGSEDFAWYLAGLACTRAWQDRFGYDLIEPEDIEPLTEMGLKEPRGSYMGWGSRQDLVGYYDDTNDAHRSLMKAARDCASELLGVCDGLDTITPADLVAISRSRFDGGKIEIPDYLRMADELADCLHKTLWDAITDPSEFFRDSPEKDDADWALCGVRGAGYYQAYVRDDDCPPKIVAHTREIANAARVAARKITKYLRATFSKKIAPGERISVRETLELMMGASYSHADPLYGAPYRVMEDNEYPMKKEEYMFFLRKRAVEFFEPVVETIGKILEEPKPKRPKQGMKL